MRSPRRIHGRPSASRTSRRKNAASRAPGARQKNLARRVFYLSFLLVAITWTVFGQTLGHDFVNFDDHVYVYDNPMVARGLTFEGLVSAFTHSHARNWHPLTTITHMLDCQLYGLKAGGHHFTSVFWHTIAVLLLFLVLRKMTGAFWRSAFVAAVFAIHPLHVESVAWVAERKDVLSAVFFMLTLVAYVRYVEAKSVARYLLVTLIFAFGLMSKPMIVTLPFVLLLLDYWPLRRFETRSSTRSKSKIINWLDGQPIPLRLFLEKIPLLALSLASCAVTLLASNQPIGSIEQLPFTWRAANALTSCIDYMGKMLWPTRLAVFYPHPNDQLPFWKVTIALIFLLAATLTSVVMRKKRPYVLTGWLWYLGMLVPVIGLVQVGEQARADRYTYLPQIGLYLVIAWAVADLTASWHRRRELLPIAATITIAALIWCATVQASYWKNSESLWTHTLAMTANNDFAHNNLGFVYLRRAELDKAISHFEAALNIRSTKPQAHYNLGTALVHNNLGNALARKGLANEAIVHYQEAIKLRPDYADAHYNFGSVLFQQGEIDEAITHWQKDLEIQPGDANAHTNLGNALLQKGLTGEAVVQYQRALEIAPQDAQAQNNLAWILATSSDPYIRNAAKAVDLAQQAVDASRGRNAACLRTLAAAYAESDRFSEAIDAAERSRQLAVAEGNSGLANDLEKEIALYRARIPRR